jgi:hypothetical protein
MRRALLASLLFCAACGDTKPDLPGPDAGGTGGGDSGLPADAGTPSDAGNAHLDGGQCGGRPSTPPDAGLRPGMGCGFQDGGHAFPELPKCCTTNADCAFDAYQWICCGQQLAVGFNVSQVSTFRSAVDAWGCAFCDCTPGGVVAEDGLATTRPVVSCDNGYCMTHAQ